MSFEVGTKVRLINGDRHDEAPEYFPALGVVGTILSEGENPLIQWPNGSTSQDDRWFCNVGNLEEYKEETKMEKRFNVGDKVVMKRKSADCISDKRYYPIDGAVGTVIENEDMVMVDWGKDSGVNYSKITKSYAWYVPAKHIELYKEEEIVEKEEDNSYENTDLKELYCREKRYLSIIESLKEDIKDFEKDLAEVRAEILKKEKERNEKETSSEVKMSSEAEELFRLSLVDFLLSNIGNPEKVTPEDYEKYLKNLFEEAEELSEKKKDEDSIDSLIDKLYK